MKGLSKYHEEESMEASEYGRIAETYIDTVYRVALSNCKNSADAQDVVQNTFVKLLKSDIDFKDDEHIKRWLIKVTVNECRSMWRSFWRRNVDYIEEIVKEPEFDTEEKSELYYAVMELPQKYRSVVHLYYYEDYSVKEISEILDIKETTIQTRLMRARKMLKQQLWEAWK